MKPKKTKPKTKTFTVQLLEDLHNWLLKYAAKAGGVKGTVIVRQLIEEEKKNKVLLKRWERKA